MVRVEDAYFMQMAIAEAAKAGNETWKNPRVGAVVVKNGQVLARGHTHEYGGIHAERDAIVNLRRNSYREQLFMSRWNPAITMGNNHHVVRRLLTRVSGEL